MEVWDPKDKITVLSQIKSFILSAERVLTKWVVRLYPGNLIKKAKRGLWDEFYAICEYYGGRISCWAWSKRWKKKNRTQKIFWYKD